MKITMILPLLLRPDLKKNQFFNNHLSVPEFKQVFQAFPQELNFNILKSVITHLYKHIW